jgi:DNA-directed RNA polymerase specialized sigma24 family protein
MPLGEQPVQLEPRSTIVPARPTPAQLERQESGGDTPSVETDLTGIVAEAVKGSQQAWSTLVERFDPMLQAIARSCQLGNADIAEVHQATWLRLVENIHRIEQPERVGAWVATTVLSESLTIARRRACRSLESETFTGVSTAPVRWTIEAADEH